MAKAYVPTSTGGWTESEFIEKDKLRVQEKENVDAVLAANAYERNHHGEIYAGEGTQTSMKKIGSISPITMMNLIQQGIFWDDKALLKWFDDLDNYLWRTTNKALVKK